MWQFGENNWIKYGWGENLSEEWKPGDTLYVDLRNHTLPAPNSTVADNAKIAVNNIIKSYPPPYTLMCSGGTDSQAMIWAWMVSGVPFNIVSIRYISEGITFNDHDLITLNEYTKKLNLTVEYKDFDVINFLENELPRYANEYDCSSPHFCIYMKMTELVETGTLLYSGNYLQLSNVKMLPANYAQLGLSRYAEQTRTKNKALIPFFLIHSPNLTISFANSVKNMIKSKGLYLIKDQTYLDIGIPICVPIKKFTGFEKLKDHYDKYVHRVDYKSKLMFINKPSKRVFDLLFRYPYENTGKLVKIGPEINLF